MEETPQSTGRLRTWVMAARLHTLPAGVSPVAVGIGLAAADDVFALGPALAALLGAILIQVGTNFANDYSDARRGTDRPDRAGFTRVTAAGLIDPETIRTAAIVAFTAALLVGTYLVFIGGVPIVIIGLSSILCGYLYTGGPRPYGYYGLGDVFVFVFFGLVAVTGTYYVQAAAVLAEPLSVWIAPETITVEALLGGIAMGALTTAILVVNNLRDIDDDRAAGKRTLAVIIGPRWTRIEYALLLSIAYLVSGWFIVSGHLSVAVTFLTLPVAGWLIRRVSTTRDGPTLNAVLTRTGQFTLAFATLFAVGVWW